MLQLVFNKLGVIYCVQTKSANNIIIYFTWIFAVYSYLYFFSKSVTDY